MEESQIDIRPYIEAFFIHRTVPRYFLSPVYLAHDPAHFLQERDGCLVVLRSRMYMGQPVLYAVLPPISLSGDLGVEMYVMMDLLEHGIGIRLSDEDIDIYRPGYAYYFEDIAKWKFVPKHEADEYVYRCGDYLSLDGDRFKHERRTMHIADREKVGYTRERHVGDYVQRTFADWYAKRGVAKSQGRILRAWNELDRPGSFILQVPGVGFSMNEPISDKGFIVPLRLREYDSHLLPRPTSYMHIVDMCYWAELFGPDALMNYGGAVGVKGLKEAKESLRPHRLLRIYHVQPTYKLTADEWREVRPR